MTSRERIAKTLAFEEPDRPPHFEQMFELHEEAFGLVMPSNEEIIEARGSEREKLFARCAEIYKRTVEEFGWDAVLVWRPAMDNPVDDPDHPQYEFIPYLKKILGPDIPVGTFLWKGLICIDTITDYMEFSVRLFEDHKKLEDLAQDMFDRGKLHIERLLDAGIDFLDIASDHAFNEGMFLPPKEFRALVLPYQKRLTRLAQERGVWVIMHTDGYLMDAMDMILEIKPDVLQSIDPMAGMDIREVKKICYGKIALMGNVQCSYLQEARADKIRESAEYCLTYGAPGGGYIYSSSNTIFPGVPLDSYRLMLDIFHKSQAGGE
jgi:uroporphyrinogen decarboxylase